MALGENIKRDKLIPDNNSNGNGNGYSNGNEEHRNNGSSNYADCQSIFNGFPNPIIVADSEGVINFANKASQGLWNSELIGKKADEILDAELGKITRPDGTSVKARITESHAQPNGELTFTYFIETEVATVGVSSGNFQKELQQLSLVADNTENAIIITAPSGEIEYVNKGFTKITGYSESEVIGKKPGSFLQGKDTDPKTVDRIRQKLSQKVSFYEEILNYGKDGEEYWLSLNITPIFDEAGKLANFIAVESDITEQKEREKELEEQKRETDALVHSIGTSNFLIEFSPQGNIMSANRGFLETFGYDEAEVIGKHHRVLCDSTYANSKEYKRFWEKLNQGLFDEGVYKRYGKDNQEIWLQATYNPIQDNTGKVIKIVKFATDVTERRERNAENRGKLRAIESSTGVIEFNLDGTIITANDIFLKSLGYSKEEVEGKHHEIFASPEYAASNEYKEFWQKLNRGAFVEGEFPRKSKDGREVWFRATYNPIKNDEGKILKVVKYAYDITEEKKKEVALGLQQKETDSLLSAIEKSNFVIEFTPDGNIIDSDKGFSKALGYSADELVGKHHSFLCEPEYAKSEDYRQFWEKLGNGEFDEGVYKRIGIDGKEIWLQATYNPIRDENGKVEKIVKFATDVTERRTRNAENRGKLRAIESSTGVIEFRLDGTIIKANDIFLKSLGYSLEEVQGKQHKIFASEEYAQSEEYKEFWQKLNRGEFIEGEFQRLGKNGETVWFKATYSPIENDEGEILKIVKYAYDITEEKNKEVALGLQTKETKSLLNAIGKSNFVIEFSPDGKILDSDAGFLKALGYSAEELYGKHHSFMCESEYAQSEEYKEFWNKLGKGEFDEGVYKRVGKGGKEIWLQATYNPILDEDGNVLKVVKFATDVTDRRTRNAENRGRIRAIQSSTGVIEFNLDGTIITANDIFLNSLGYSLEEVKGKHHKIFASEEYAQSEEYKEFWQMLNRGEFVEGEFQRIGKNGERVWFRATYNPIKNDEGDLLKVVKYAYDITERKKGEKELVRLAMVANSTNNAVIITNAKGEIEYVNQAFTDITEYPADEVIGMKPGTFLQGPDTDQETVTRIREKLANKESFYEEILNYGKHGRPYWLGLNVTPVLGEDGEVLNFLAVESDITEQKEREQDLQEAFEKQKEQQAQLSDANNRANIAQNLALVGDFGIDMSTLELSWSDKMHEMLKVDKDEKLDYNYYRNLAAEEDRSELDSALAKLVEKGESAFEHDIITTDGNRLRVALSTKITARDDEGKPTFAIGVLQNITELYEQQKELKRSADFVQKIFDLSQDGLVVMEGDKFVDTNQAYLDIIGAESEEEVIGKSPIDHSPKFQADGSVSAESIQPLIEEVIEKGEVFFSWQFTNRGGNLIDVEINGVLVEMRGEVPVMQFTIRDVTERKKAREAVEKSEQNFRQITGATPGMLFKLETDAGSNPTFTYVSEYSNELFETPAQNFVDDIDYLWANDSPRRFANSL